MPFLMEIFWQIEPKSKSAISAQSIRKQCSAMFVMLGKSVFPKKYWIIQKRIPPPFFQKIETLSTYEGNWLCRNVCHSRNWCHLPHTESHFVLVQTSIWDIKWHFAVNILEIYLLCHEWEPSFIKTPYRIWQYGLSSFNFNS